MWFIDALGALYKLEADQSLLSAIRSAANWLLGENRRRAALYHFKTGKLLGRAHRKRTKPESGRGIDAGVFDSFSYPIRAGGNGFRTQLRKNSYRIHRRWCVTTARLDHSDDGESGRIDFQSVPQLAEGFFLNLAKSALWRG